MNSPQFGFSLYLDLTGKARDTATSPNFQFCHKYCFGSVKSRLPTETKTDLASVFTSVHMVRLSDFGQFHPISSFARSTAVKSRLPTETKTDLASVKTSVHGRGCQWVVRFDWQPFSIASTVPPTPTPLLFATSCFPIESLTQSAQVSKD